MPAEKAPSPAAGPPGSRGQRLWERALEQRENARLSPARALLVLVSYRETKNLPAPVRRARALEKIVGGIPIFIEPDELLVGAFSAKPMYFEWYPEYAVDQEMLSRDLDGLLAANHSRDDIAGIVLYLKDSCLQSSFFALFDEARKQKIKDACEEGAWVYRAKTTLDIDRGYHAVDYEKAGPNEASTVSGRRMTVDEVMREVLRDRKFYENSGGGGAG